LHQQEDGLDQAEVVGGGLECLLGRVHRGDGDLTGTGIVGDEADDADPLSGPRKRTQADVTHEVNSRNVS